MIELFTEPLDSMSDTPGLFASIKIIDDPRIDRAIYPLENILCFAICAAIAGADDFVAINHQQVFQHARMTSLQSFSISPAALRSMIVSMPSSSISNPISLWEKDPGYRLPFDSFQAKSE